jgi:hypothetical protein
VSNNKKEKNMGLDMYAYVTPATQPQQVDFEALAPTEIHCWRKHPNLHGWMEQLYRDKGGETDVFNCVNVQLAAGDLDDLELAIKADALPLTTGFFFGQSDGTERADDLAFIAKAREALAENLCVFYSSWW